MENISSGKCLMVSMWLGDISSEPQVYLLIIDRVPKSTKLKNSMV